MSEETDKFLEPVNRSLVRDKARLPVGAQSTNTELEVSKVGVIDRYDPAFHTGAASFIEPRLANFTAEEAAERRRFIGIIPSQGTDWIFVEVSDLPQQTQTPDEPTLLIKDDNRLPPGAYTCHGSSYLVNSEGRFFMDGIRKMGFPGEIVADASIPLSERKFREVSGVGGVPFPSSDKLAVKEALLNAVAPGLAKDYFPDDPEADQYRFYNDDNGEVFADIPPHRSEHLLELPSPE